MVNRKDVVGLPLVHEGKIRNVYDLGQSYLIVASDRISAFDCVIPTMIPNKGKILHKLSMFWFDFVQNIVPNHIITGNFESFPTMLRQYEYLRDRSMLVKKAKRVDIECIVRGYLAGSGWKEYKNSQTVCGIELPVGLRESSELPEPVFTPSSKERGGKHDENISFEETVKRVGRNVAENLRKISLDLYKKASKYSLSKGIIVADTKFEFGFYDNQLILIDEILTPDSSRFWESDKYEVGKSQDSLDKQYVRDYLEHVNWDKSSPAPEFPEDVVKNTIKKYVSVYEKLTGENL
ncbi:MAG: phosphoribosylaminoimidazolesuccinocarboxamide synthase [Endomicrobium sp.]|nr:phosphoribosylaminoimidazolesuccinocarboxamide synthase [Endomicrobium sp.]